MLSACSAPQSEPEISASTSFYHEVMNTAPYLPDDKGHNNLCADPNNLRTDYTGTYQTSKEVDYSNARWEERVSHDWNAFPMLDKSMGKVLVIDIKQNNGEAVYHYMSNANTQATLYEPWSSSKIFAFTGAIAALKKQSNSIVSAQGKIGHTNIADLITSINSYEAFGDANGDSNAIATFFANVATREYLTALFYEKWLRLSTPHIFFRGSYGASSFEPQSTIWSAIEGTSQTPLDFNNDASKDKSYRPYRCETCGTTGNKPMTTLAQAEWLKRLAMHQTDAKTRHPFLDERDIKTLFYGAGNSTGYSQLGGMSVGISTMLQDAIAKQLIRRSEPHVTLDTLDTTQRRQKNKSVLDSQTNGLWRVFNKIGWGPSETRGTTENVLLAYVCLPMTALVGESSSVRPENESIAFVIAAQVAVDGASEELMGEAGQKMQDLIDTVLTTYFSL